MPTLTFGSLFAGIGGIDLGLERAGMRCAWQVEIDDYATKVLAKHWPDVTRFRDVRECGKHNLSRVDLIAGGFPCQDISDAGKQAGIEGERSGLWAEFFRIICELRPRFVLVENVAALTHRGMGRVLGDLAAGGYDAEWQILSAESVGAPHIRERVFIVAYTPSCGMESQRVSIQGRFTMAHPHRSSAEMANAQSEQWNGRGNTWDWRDRSANSSKTMANTQSIGCDPRGTKPAGQFGESGTYSACAQIPNTDFQSLEVGPCFGRDARQKLTAFKRDCSTGTGQWATEPGICRVANGIPHRVDRLRGLGNAVVPQVAEFVGRCIVAIEAERQGVA